MSTKNRKRRKGWKVRTTISLDGELLRVARRIAAEDHRTLSSYLSMLVHQEAEKSGASVLRRAA